VDQRAPHWHARTLRRAMGSGPGRPPESNVPLGARAHDKGIRWQSTRALRRVKHGPGHPIWHGPHERF
jgi:hypothetical protein